MTKGTVDAILSQFKDKLAVIIMDNNMKLPVNYANGRRISTIDNIDTITIGNTDFLRERRIDHTTGEIYYNLLPVSIIQGIIYTEEDFAPIDYMSKL